MLPESTTDSLPIQKDFSFWKKITLVSIFFFITPITLVVSMFSLISLSDTDQPKKAKNTPQLSYGPSKSGVSVYASLPASFPSIESEVVEADARVEKVRQYLEKNGSALTPYANLIVAIADKYSVDYRLTTAIAQKESGLCNVIPPQSYNCWGWGITSKGVLRFSSYQEGVEEVTRGLKENYLDKGYVTLEEIMSKYTPLSKGTWSEGVLLYMSQI